MHPKGRRNAEPFFLWSKKQFHKHSLLVAASGHAERVSRHGVTIYTRPTVRKQLQIVMERT